MDKFVFTILILTLLLGCNAPDKVTEEVKTSSNVENGQDSTEITQHKYLEKSKKIAATTQGILGKNLVNAINTKGTAHAVDFCSVKAIPLTDSSALALNAKIKRVSDKNRNPDNVPNESELAYIEDAKEQLEQGKEIQPQLLKKDGKHIGYYPIVANAMCLQCHGTPEKEVNLETLNKIQALYPEDKALGYTANELRGIWVVEMDKLNP